MVINLIKLGLSWCTYFDKHPDAVYKPGDKIISLCDGCEEDIIEHIHDGLAFKMAKGVTIFCKNCGIGANRCSYGCNKEELENGWDCGLDDSGVY